MLVPSSLQYLTSSLTQILSSSGKNVAKKRLRYPPTYEETEVPPTYEETEVPPTYEETEVPPTYEETEVPPTYEETGEPSYL